MRCERLLRYRFLFRQTMIHMVDVSNLVYSAPADRVGARLAWTVEGMVFSGLCADAGARRESFAGESPDFPAVGLLLVSSKKCPLQTIEAEGPQIAPCHHFGASVGGCLFSSWLPQPCVGKSA